MHLLSECLIAIIEKKPYISQFNDVTPTIIIIA